MRKIIKKLTYVSLVWVIVVLMSVDVSLACRWARARHCAPAPVCVWTDVVQKSASPIQKGGPIQKGAEQGPAPMPDDMIGSGAGDNSASGSGGGVSPSDEPASLPPAPAEAPAPAPPDAAGSRCSPRAHLSPGHCAP